MSQSDQCAVYFTMLIILINLTPSPVAGNLAVISFLLINMYKFTDLDSFSSCLSESAFFFRIRVNRISEYLCVACI